MMLSFLLVFLIEFPIYSERVAEPLWQYNKETGNAVSAADKTNMAYRWAQVALIATANDTDRFKPRPTITSRYLALVFTSVFDAWSRYDSKAIPVYLQNVDRRPSSEATLSNKEIAISYAAYQSMCEYFYSDKELFKNFMLDLGLDPDNRSLDPNTPEGIGNLAAKAVIESRRNDGSNQYGEQSPDKKPYADYTGYEPVNSADESKDPIRWQPKYFSDGRGGKFAPSCLTPFWGKVKPIGMKSGDQFRPIPPPELGSKQLRTEVKEVVDLQANLTDEQKALIEFMRDGPKSVQQAGHWLAFALELSVKYNHSLDQDVKMYFYNQVTAMDAFIACWDSKMFYDYARPFALVHEFYKDQKISGWAGPGKGVVQMNGQEWRPYSPDVFLCPPFPSYVSGHSAVSGGCAEALKLFTGRDDFGLEVKMVAGALTDPDHPGKEITLKFPTLTGAAELAGISRVMGGYHIQSENVQGLKLGRDVAHETWKFYNRHIGRK
jgi:hypothetical protein